MANFQNYYHRFYKKRLWDKRAGKVKTKKKKLQVHLGEIQREALNTTKNKGETHQQVEEGERIYEQEIEKKLRVYNEGRISYCNKTAKKMARHQQKVTVEMVKNMEVKATLFLIKNFNKKVYKLCSGGNKRRRPIPTTREV